MAEKPDVQQNWQKQDTVWMLSLYGTAIGAGVLFLPIDVGLHGIWPLLIMLILAFPITYFPHQALCRFILANPSTQRDITGVADEFFGPWIGGAITLLYLFTIYPIMLLYSIAITNTVTSFLEHQLHLTPPPRIVLSLGLILLLMSIVHAGQAFIIRLMSTLVYPFVFILMIIALYLIPFWNLSIFTTGWGSPVNNWHTILSPLWLMIPVMVFSFNHSAIISSFAVAQKGAYGDQADIKASYILRRTHLLMVSTVMFFVCSCVLSLSPHDLQLAKQENISILSYLANHFQTPFLAYLAPLIAFVAIAKSFLGHYLGANEGLQRLVVKPLQTYGIGLKNKALLYLLELGMVITCWIAATLNPSILHMIEFLIGPIIAIILFLLPMYAIATIPALKQYRNLPRNIFVTVVGLIAISALVYGSWMR